MVRSLTMDAVALQERCSHPLSAMPRPFIKWAGSKRFLLKHFVDLLPSKYGTYWEPFLGSGSLFFLMQPTQAVLSDACSELISTYTAVRDNPSAVLRFLTPLEPNEDVFYQVRENPSSGPYRRAAEFIFLNKTCWNGLYRVNSSGKFNVPFGWPSSESVVDSENLKSCASALRESGVRVLAGDFESILKDTSKGDLVFLDPPYITGHNNNGFVDYNRTLFSWADQERLADVAHALGRRGVRVIVTNADHEAVIALYSGFSVRQISRKSTLAGDTTKRRDVTEVVIHNLQ